MSGFVGLWQRDGKPVDPAQLAALTESLRFRGPDGLGTWRQGAIGLGHARFTTHAGRDSEPQPLGLDGRYWITGDIRLDARDELIAALVGTGATVAPGSQDAALVLRAYRAWGEDCMTRIHGDFAFGIWDAQEHRLFCARDPFGIKPFFYASFPDLFVFGNTLDCVRQHPRISARLDELALADFLCCGRLLEPHMSFFAEVRRLPPGHTLLTSAEGLRFASYWTLPVEPYLRYRQPQQYVEHFNDVFSRAVADRAGDGPLSVFLSGGLDSATIAAAATGKLGARTVRGPVWACTVGWNCAFRDPEPEHARITAAALGLPIEVLEEPDCKPFKARGAAAAPEADDNFYRESLVRTLQHLSGFGRVALNGQGSDEVFYRELLVDEAKRSPGWQLALDAARTWYVTGRRPPIGLRAGARRDGPRLSAAQAPKWPNWIEPAWALRLDLAGRLAILAAPVREAKTTPHAAARTRLRSPFWAPYVERYDAGFSGAAIETRWPFLDARIIRFALSLPPFPWSVEKHVLRRALQPLLPAPVARRPKTRLQGEPFSAYLGADPAWPDKAMEQVMSLEGYVRPSRWRGLLESQTTLPLESAWSLGRPVALSLWLNSQPATAHETALRA